MARKIEITENDLVTLLKDKDQRAYNILYNNYSRTLYDILYKVVQSKDTSADLLQDAFVKIWKNIDRYNPSKGCLFTWMLTITRNLALDRVRSATYRETAKNVILDDYMNQVDEQHHYKADFDGMNLQKIIERLLPKYQLMIDLVYYEGYTQSEISQKYNIPIGTVKTRIKNAILQLKTMID